MERALFLRQSTPPLRRRGRPSIKLCACTPRTFLLQLGLVDTACGGRLVDLGEVLEELRTFTTCAVPILTIFPRACHGTLDPVSVDVCAGRKDYI